VCCEKNYTYSDICIILFYSNVVNLLTVIPSSCYTPIIQSVESDDCKNVYQNMDMSAICVLLRFLDQRLDYTKNLIENISPIVTALIRLVKSKRIIRKYIRLQVKFHNLKLRYYFSSNQIFFMNNLLKS